MVYRRLALQLHFLDVLKSLWMGGGSDRKTYTHLQFFESTIKSARHTVILHLILTLITIYQREFYD
jgi:hypothetical protein